MLGDDMGALGMELTAVPDVGQYVALSVGADSRALGVEWYGAIIFFYPNKYI